MNTTFKFPMKRTVIAAVLGSLIAFGVNAQVSDDVVNGVKLRGDGTVDNTQPASVVRPAGAAIDVRGRGLVEDNPASVGAGGIDLRGDGTPEDRPAAGTVAGVSDDIVNGVKLRGDGSVDDTQPGGGTATTGIVKTRGDGSIDDTQTGQPDDHGGLRNRGRGADDSARSASSGRSGPEDRGVSGRSDDRGGSGRSDDRGGSGRSGGRVEVERVSRSDQVQRPEKVEVPKLERIETQKAERIDVQRPQRVEVQKAERIEVQKPQRVEVQKLDRIERSGRGGKG